MSANSTLVPLQSTTDDDLQKLYGYLWKWQLCGTCSGEPGCIQTSCPWGRKEAIVSALDRYKRLTLNYIPDYFAKHALSCHDDLLQIIRLIKDHSDDYKLQLMNRFFAPSGQQAADVPTIADQERAFNLAASLLLSVNCGIPGVCIDRTDDSSMPLLWESSMSINTFVLWIFGKNLGATNQGRAQAIDQQMLRSLTVKLLKQKAGLRFEPTNDLHCHLRFDLKTRTVYIFDATAVLEEMLLASMDEPSWCLIHRGVLIEILCTIYKVLFPPGRESQIVLSSLTKQAGFDNGMLRYTTELFSREDDPEVDYSYFGDRLLELHNELKDPSPRNWFERLFEGGTRSAERKMLMATTIGVFIAVTIGLFGLVIAGFQAWVGYQQWKHPVEDQ